MNQSTAQAAQHNPNQTSQTPLADASVSIATGTTVIATNRLNQPSPRPSAPL